MQETGCQAWLPCTHSLNWVPLTVTETPENTTTSHAGPGWLHCVGHSPGYKVQVKPTAILTELRGKGREREDLSCIAQGSADPPDHHRPLLQFLRTSDKSPQAASLSKESSLFISTSLFLETLTAPLSRNNPSDFSLCWSHTVKTPIIKFPMFGSLLLLLCNSGVQSKKSGADWHLSFFFFFLSLLTFYHEMF